MVVALRERADDGTGVRWDPRAGMATDYQTARSMSVMRPSEAARAEGRPTTGETVIAVRGLRMSYGDLEAVRGIDLDVHRGEVFALLGPNGAGKTTVVEILEGS